MSVVSHQCQAPNLEVKSWPPARGHRWAEYQQFLCRHLGNVHLLEHHSRDECAKDKAKRDANERLC